MKIRIVHIIDGLGSGGAERLLTVYATELHRQGNDVHVLVLNDRSGNPEQRNIETAGVPTTLIPVGKLRNIFQIARFFLKLRKMRPDVVHAHLQFSSILSSILCRAISVPCLATIHTLEGPELSNRNGVRRWLMYKTLDRFCDRVVCLSETAAQFARKNGLSHARIEVLPNGIDLKEYFQRSESERLSVRQQLEIPYDAQLIVTVAVLRAPKGIDRLIRAMPAILKKSGNARLLVVGDGPEMDRLVSLAADLGIPEMVIFAGRRTDVPDLMATADLFVLPTLDDAQPTVVMEAMASRLPVIASRVGGIPDMIEDGVDGILVPPDDVPALETAACDLLADSSRCAALSTAGRVTVEDRFSLEQQVTRLTRLYETLLEEAQLR